MVWYENIFLIKSFKEITDEQIVEVQNRLNRRPRKILGYKTPAKVFFDTITSSYVAVESGVALTIWIGVVLKEFDVLRKQLIEKCK